MFGPIISHLGHLSWKFPLKKDLLQLQMLWTGIFIFALSFYWCNITKIRTIVSLPVDIIFIQIIDIL